MNLVHELLAAEPLFRDQPLLRFEGKSWSFEAVFEEARAIADFMAVRGVKQADRVVLLAQNHPAWIASFIAVLRLGAVAVPINAALTASEVGYIVEHAAPKLMLVGSELRDRVPNNFNADSVFDMQGVATLAANIRQSSNNPVAEIAGSDPAALFYTSGTTGRPKGVLLSHENIVAIGDIAIGSLLPSSAPGAPRRSSLVCTPLPFIYAILTNCLSCIRSGRTMVLLERFHPGLALEAIARESVTDFLGVPTMFAMLLNWAADQPVAVPSLTFCLSSGQNLPWKLASLFEERFGVAVLDFWGQTEGTPITGYDPRQEFRVRPDSCGRALTGCSVTVIDEHGSTLPADEVGEVLLRGPSVMLGYYNNPSATEQTLRDGWIHTGDLGRLDRDGYLYIVGRKRDMIIRGGANVYPAEIESVLHQHHAVLECGVVGVPDELFGEVIKAFVVCRGEKHPTPDELMTHCRQFLAEYKVPTIYEWPTELPKGPTGKILKRVLSDSSAREHPG